MERVAAKDRLLAHARQLGALDPRDPSVHHHDLVAEAVDRRALLALDLDVAREERDLRALVDGAPVDRLSLAEVLVVERPAERDGRPRDRRYRRLLGLVGRVVGRGHRDAVAGPPAGVSVEGERGRTLGSGRAEARPAGALLAVDLERPAHHAEHLGTHAHDVLARVGAGDSMRARFENGLSAAPIRSFPCTMTQSEVRVR